MVPVSSAVASVATDWPDPICPLASALHAIVNAVLWAATTGAREVIAISAATPAPTALAPTHAARLPPNRRLVWSTPNSLHRASLRGRKRPRKTTRAQN